MNITVVGSGYVGLVTGACIAEMGNTVYCVDVDKSKIENLKQGILPIYEPGLEEIVTENHSSGRLLFTTSLSEAAEQCEVYFIAVGTPPGEDGSADLRYVLEVARQIGDTMTGPAIVVNKSTVPVGTADLVRAAVTERLEARGSDIAFSVVSNPEFLKEGAAVDDFMHPDRIVIGADNEHARQVMSALYAPFIRNRPRTMFMGIRDAEMTKYAANAMLATKISFMNEIASLCERLDVDVENVRLGIGSDERIGYHFIYAGCGYGGSCFPKDVKALINIAHQNDFEPKLLQAVESRNDQQKHSLFNKISAHFNGDLKGRTFAVWGLAFKPGTDDMREAPSVVLINSLINAGAKVRAFDPVARETARREFPESWFADGRLQIVEGQYEAAIDADALFLVTEWKPFRRPDFRALKRLLNTPLIIDGRNQYDREQVKLEGFSYYGIGRQPVHA
ncbi:UDP-glucose/GDP-mannose dehydrogenase family protein [Stutzerimonas zhaodongensis]|uniref:UDP-glucose 6-dehydrogenase n=1 Tax=Stutzerimonas zhaodongensis TaxID=1176257 RepID=A0A3M2HWE2_9GAMM|nr:UDP-glucose/GDP-mannose dehydrogenase family protein [Stutzerimonas zhaodongensis]MCQ2028717.1 UDP-glucose/GDP-mannose dehydrogenase family protein [Stutzerimonas zhaodongensis]MCQ4315314.1 UDP-glucose/GDP-mannose dehydrogenase family protein [Stutzerimonas zhaodongensis]RMH90124.1 UDP-glucose/GDP-mannose dehydrogenase family protein [Stutzerimonas zhaodongensis]